MRQLVNLISEFSGKHENLRRCIENALMRIQEQAIVLDDNVGRKRKHIAIGMRIAARTIAIEMGSAFLMGFFERLV